MQFYLLMLLLAPLLLRRHWWITILAMVLGAVAWRLGAQMLILIDGPMGVFPLFVAVTQLPGTLDGFAAGLVLARLVVDPRAGRLLAAGRRHPWIPLLATILLWWGVMALFWSNDADWSTWWTVALWRCGVALAMGAVVATACCASGRILTVATAPLRYLGVISYGIYLWHLPVIEALHRIGPIAAPHALTIVLPVTLIFAAGSWHVFETPILERFGRGPIRAPRPASALPQQAT